MFPPSPFFLALDFKLQVPSWFSMHNLIYMETSEGDSVQNTSAMRLRICPFLPSCTDQTTDQQSIARGSPAGGTCILHMFGCVEYLVSILFYYLLVVRLLVSFSSASASLVLSIDSISRQTKS